MFPQVRVSPVAPAGVLTLHGPDLFSLIPHSTSADTDD